MADTSLEKDKIRVLLLEGIHENAVENLKQRLLQCGAAHRPDWQRSDGQDPDAHFIGIRSRTQLTEEVFAAAEN